MALENSSSEASGVPMLPDDVVITIMHHLPCSAILCLRQICRRFYQLTFERSLWVHWYRTSNLFLPPGPFPDQPLHEIERLIVRAIKLDANWNSPSPIPVRTRTFIPYPYSTIEDHRVRFIRLLQGRYLMVGGRTAFALHDLDAISDLNRPICVVEEASCQLVYYEASMDEPGDSVSSLGVLKQTRMHNYSIVVWSFAPLEAEPLMKVAEVPLRPTVTPYIRISHQFLVDASNREPITRRPMPTLFHISTQQSYTFPTSQEAQAVADTHSTYRLEFIFTPKHILMMYLTATQGAPALLEAYDLPDDHSTSYVLTRTHSGVCNFGFTEPILIGAQSHVLPLHESTTSITLLAFTHRPGTRILPFRVVLSSDGLITISKPYIFPQNTFISIPFDLYTSGTDSGMARAVSLSALVSTEILAYSLQACNVHAEDANHADVQVRKLRLGEHVRGAYDIAFDGFRGRLCLVLHTGTVEVLDYV